jgi:hypothetical protein
MECKVWQEPTLTGTLAGLNPGQSGRVTSFLFGSLRVLCGDLGIREGDIVRCRAGTAGVLVLDTEDGDVVSVAREWARFIQVGPEPAPVEA